MSAPRPVAWSHVLTANPTDGPFYTVLDVRDECQAWGNSKVRSLPVAYRMSDGSLIVVHAKRPWKVGERAYLPQLKVSGVIHKVHDKGLGELKRDDGVIHGVRLSDLRRAPDGR